MFKGDSADTCTGKFSLMTMGGRSEGLACADPGARTTIGANGNMSYVQMLCIYGRVMIKNTYGIQIKSVLN